MNNTTQIQHSHNHSNWPACIGVEEASKILGWPLYFFPLLLPERHLKPLGKPAQNGRKWFARVEIERLSADLAWSDKAVRHLRSTCATSTSSNVAAPIPSEALRISFWLLCWFK